MRESKWQNCRYGDNLENVLVSLGGVSEYLKIDFEDNYQGHVYIDAKLTDGRVFVYGYPYGSCSGCDEWEDRRLTDTQIEAEMLKDAVIYDNVQDYEAAMSRGRKEYWEFGTEED